MSCTDPVIHQQVLHNEIGHNRLHWRGKLVWGQHGDMTKRHKRSDELLGDIGIQTTWQRLVREGKSTENQDVKRKKMVQDKRTNCCREKAVWSWKPLGLSLTSNICASCTSLLLKIAWIQWIACLAWWGVPRLAFWCRIGIKVLMKTQKRILEILSSSRCWLKSVKFKKKKKKPSST